MKPLQRTRALRKAVAGTVVLGALAALIPSAMANTAQVSTAAPPVSAQTVKASKGMMVSLCGFSHRASVDPIVHPGMTNMSHSHDFFGNRTTNADSTLASLTGQPTTCRTAGDRAAYWTPTMYANNKAMEPNGMLAYFTAMTTNPVAELPIGLKIVAGGRAHVRYACFNNGMPRAQTLRPQHCGRDELLSLGVRFPDCWNGVDLDSSDHRSHMAYSVEAACPSTHPVAVPRLSMWVLYRPPAKRATLTFSSGGLETAHADFFNAFDPATQTKLHDFCINAQRTCYKQMYLVLKRLGLPRNGPAAPQKA